MSLMVLLMIFVGLPAHADRPLVRVLGHEPYFAALGRVESPKGSCTGTIVGRRLVLTARHCLKTAKDVASGGYWFYPTQMGNELRNGGPPLRAVQAWASQVHRGVNLYEDWALLLLEEHPKARDGVRDLPGLEVTDTDAAFERADVLEVVGYAGDTFDGRHPMKCVGGKFLQRSSRKVYTHDCRTEHGMSGGPVIASERRELVSLIFGGMQDEEIVSQPAFALFIGLIAGADMLGAGSTGVSTFRGRLQWAWEQYGRVWTVLSASHGAVSGGVPAGALSPAERLDRNMAELRRLYRETGR